MKLEVNAKNGDYTVDIGKWSVLKKTSRHAVVTDANVYSLYKDEIERCFSPDTVVVLAPGEKSKNETNLFHILGRLIEEKFVREDVLIAVGGGVVGDISGLAASMYMRGMKLVQVPTTLLAQVDSSVGGKTAVNFGGAKNIVGAFYQPSLVICSADVLKTLPPREFSAGMAEVIKYGAIFDEDLFFNLDNKSISEIVKRCIELKAGVVERDTFDTGERMFLNFGHTFAHAIESYFEYGRYLHGEAVAVGMLLAARLGTKLGITPRETETQIADVIEKFGLSSIVPEIPAKSMVSAMLNDKKAAGRGVRFILIEKIGKPVLYSVPDEELEQLLGSIL